jgi:hypothetical protein
MTWFSRGRDLLSVGSRRRNATRLDAPDSSGWTGLHRAAAAGDVKMLDVLLDGGRPPGCRGPGGRTPLHKAAGAGQIAAIERLIAAGAEVDARDDRGHSPSFLAVFEGHDACVVCLLGHGASVTMADTDGYTLLHLAALRGRQSIVERLIELGVDPNAESAQGFTPLDGAAEGGFPEIARCLRTQGAIHQRGTRDGTRALIDEAVQALDGRDFSAAITAADTALELNPRCADAHVIKGDAIRQRGDEADSLAWYDRALGIDGGLIAAWGGKGNALMELERYDEAVACFEEVLRRSPADDTACFNIAISRDMQGGRDDEAIRWLQATLDRDPSHARARRLLDELQARPHPQ